MNQLPFEILENIFLLLDQYDKIECMSVCQYWKQSIERFALYHSIYIFSAKALKKVTSKIQNSGNGKKVEQLVLSFFNEKEHIDLNPLLLQLPNLRRFFCVDPKCQTLRTSKIIHPWQKSIEFIYEFSCGSATSRSLLQQGVCPNLTRITIPNYDNSILPLLKNAPALKNLTLHSGILNFMDLETVHECAPRLQSITLHNIIFNDKTQVDSMTIVPSHSVTECIFEDLVTDQLYSRKEPVIYISKKYPNISKIVYTHHPNFNHDWITLSDETFLSNLLQSVGTRLKYLSINGQAFCNQNPFKILDRHRCQLKTLKLGPMDLHTEEMVGSQQFSHIEKLCLEDSNVIHTFDCLKEFAMLQKLKLIGYKCDWQLELGRLLDQTPLTFKSLSLYRICYSLADRVYPSVESLSFAMCSVMSGSTMSRCFPNLSKLKIRNCDIPKGSLELPSMDLFSFRFILNHNDDNGNDDEMYYAGDVYYDNGNDVSYSGIDNSILVITKNERRRYAKREHEVAGKLQFIRQYKMFYPQVISWPERERDPKPRYTFHFNSLKNMIFE